MNSEVPLLPAGGSPPAGPQPMESNAPPPFLTKTYDMVDDAATETIVSWSKGNNSFVVWNPPEFSQDLLPKYFKHNNFSSFVRQLNTYGFRKVDPDRWEFANEGFLRGRRELLRGIHRRKPAAHSQQQQQAAADGALGPCVEVGRLGLEKEIEMLKRDKSLLVLELARLRQEQQNTEHELQVMGERLQAAEQRQQQIMAFLAKAVQTPGFLVHLVEQNENNKCMAASARKRRRLPKEEDEGEVEDSVGHSTPTDNQSITLQNNREVVGHIMQLLNPSDDLSLTIDNSYLDSLLRNYTSAPAGSEGNSLNRHSGVTLTELSTGLAENLQSDPALTDLRNNEGIVQLPQSPTSGENLEQGNGSSQSGTRDSRDSNIESIDLNGRGPGVSTEVEEEGPKLYVGNLPWTCDSQQLAEIFQDFGNVELVEVIYDRETSRSRGFGFVTMGSQEEATAAKEKLDGYVLGGRALTVSFPQANRGGGRPPSERPLRDRPFGGGGGGYDSENKLFVGNLSWSVDDESLRAKFSDYGKVLDARVIYDRETGRSRGFGFVTYSNADEVNDAIQNLDGADYDGRQIRVNLAGDKPPPRAREF
ncbi:unnamed protein product [Sphagnum compactum]